MVLPVNVRSVGVLGVVGLGLAKRSDGYLVLSVLPLC